MIFLSRKFLSHSHFFAPSIPHLIFIEAKTIIESLRQRLISLLNIINQLCCLPGTLSTMVGKWEKSLFVASLKKKNFFLLCSSSCIYNNGNFKLPAKTDKAHFMSIILINFPSFSSSSFIMFLFHTKIVKQMENFVVI